MSPYENYACNPEEPIKRPPWRPKEYDLEQLANEILQWSKKSDSINLTQFVSEKEFPPQYISRWCNESSYFCEVLSMAKVNIGLNRQRQALEAKLTQQEFTRHEYRYDPFYREDERDEKTFESNLKKDVDKENKENTIHAAAEALKAIFSENRSA